MAKRSKAVAGLNIKLSPSQLREFLLQTVPAKINVLLQGAPGIGKTDIITQVCDELGFDLVLDFPALSDPTDFKGLPFATNGHASFLPFGNNLKLIEATKPTLCLGDDFGQAPPAVQAAWMQVLQARRVGDHKVSDHVSFVCATNRRQDRASVTGILEPVKSRFVIAELQPDLDDWCRWALAAKLPPALVAFVRFKPTFLWDFKPTPDITNGACPRTVAKVGELMGLGLQNGLEMPSYAGAAGEGFATEFIAFLRIFRDLPNPDYVLKNPETANVPSSDKPGVMYALATSLASRANKKNAANLMKYARRLPPDFAVLIVRDAGLLAGDDFVNGNSELEDWAIHEGKDVLI